MDQTMMSDIVEQAKQGDAHAFSLLYETIYKDMYRFALYTLKNPHDAEDTVSEAVLDAFFGIGKVRDVHAFRAWMFQILSAKCKRKLKSYVNKTVPMEEQDEQMSGRALDQDLADNCDLQNAMQRLTEQERWIVGLSYIAGFRSKEIAHQLHMNSNTVRSVQSRALVKLRHMLE
jgi:RNA polymerase sigma-70 factor (ECF subfamily)